MASLAERMRAECLELFEREIGLPWHDRWRVQLREQHQVVLHADIAGFGANGPAIVWDALRSAVIEADPVHQGDEEAFCEAYGSNEYALDLR